jgi:TolA-binding protein
MPSRQRPRETRASLEQELKDVQRRIAEAEQREADRLGKLAIQAGLTRLELDEKTVIEEFKKIAARFQEKPSEAPHEPAKQGRKPARKRGAQPPGQPSSAPNGADRGAPELALEVRSDPGANQPSVA